MGLFDQRLGFRPVDARQVEVHGVALAVVRAPDGTLVELVDTPAVANLDRLTSGETS